MKEAIEKRKVNSERIPVIERSVSSVQRGGEENRGEKVREKTEWENLGNYYDLENQLQKREKVRF